MEHKIDVIRQEDEIGDILTHKPVVRVASEMADVFRIARDEVVEANHPVPLRKKTVSQVRAKEACTAGDHGDGTG